MSQQPQTFIGRLIAAIVNIFHKAEPIVDDILDWADKIVNEIKQLIDHNGALLSMVEKIIETNVPAATGLINALKLAFPAVAAVIANGKDESNKTDEEKLQDLMNYLKGLKTSDPVLYAGALNTINAWIQQFFAQNSGVVSLTPQMSLAGAQVKHDETLGAAA